MTIKNRALIKMGTTKKISGDKISKCLMMS